MGTSKTTELKAAVDAAAAKVAGLDKKAADANAAFGAAHRGIQTASAETLDGHVEAKRDAAAMLDNILMAQTQARADLQAAKEAFGAARLPELDAQLTDGFAQLAAGLHESVKPHLQAAAMVAAIEGERLALLLPMYQSVQPNPGMGSAAGVLRSAFERGAFGGVGNVEVVFKRDQLYSGSVPCEGLHVDRAYQAGEKYRVPIGAVDYLVREGVAELAKAGA